MAPGPQVDAGDTAIFALQERSMNDYASILRDDLGNTCMGCGFDKSCSYIP